MASSETRTRLLTALKWVPTVGGIVLYSPLLWNLFICMIVVGALMEYRRFMNYVWPGQKGFGNEKNPSETKYVEMDYLFFFLGFVLSATAAYGNVIFYNVATVFCLNALFCLHFMIVTASQKKVDTHTLYQLMVYFFGFMYIAWPLSHASLVQALPKYGPGLMFVTLICSWFGDGMGYFLGKRYGQVRLVPYISPGKSVEGFIVNVVASTLPMLFFYHLKHQYGLCQQLLPPMDLNGYIIIGITFGTFGPLGDLLESYLKRAAGVKDSGDFFAGHGGMLDRFDTFLLLIPIIYYYSLFTFDFS